MSVSPRLHTRVLEILRRRIEGGFLPGGTKLMESPLSLELGISRAPVRQALMALASEGVLHRADGRGFIVKSVGKARVVSAGEDPADILLTLQPSWQPIYDVVEKAIAERISVASWRIVEVDLARHFGVSRTVAREVMARLHQRGLIKRDDKARWFAPALTAQYIAELYEMRWTLEPLALTKASEHVPKGLLLRMYDDLQDAMRRASSLEGGELDALEAQLHIELLGYCSNRTLIEALRIYQSLLVAHTFLYAVSPTPFPSEPFLPEHLVVVERLLDRDINGASRAMAEHLAAARDRAAKRIAIVSRALKASDLPYMHRLG